MHVVAIAALTVLLALGIVQVDVGFPLLAGLLGFGAGVGVTPNPSGGQPSPGEPTASTATSGGATSTPTTTMGPVSVAVGGSSVALTPQQAQALGVTGQSGALTATVHVPTA